MEEKNKLNNIPIDDYKYGFKDDAKYSYVSKKGLDEEVIYQISKIKGEPQWMTDFRIKAYHLFKKMPMPKWGADLSEIDFDDLYYYIKPADKQGKSWDDVPDYIKDTFNKLGIPQAEQKWLAGVGAQYESEVIYHRLKEKWAKKGVIFVDTDTGLREYPELFKEYFGTVIPAADNKFAALNSAVWSGGSFIYIPKGVKVEIPLQAYFRINYQNMGQFERTLIIADEGSFVHYVEGCTAPIYSSDSLHAAVVEIVVKKGARVRYSTVQNWSKNVYNLVTKRAVCYEDATMEWVDGNLGSKITMKYPAVVLKGRGAHGEILSIALATGEQHIDAGAKVIHIAPDTTSNIVSKSISARGGRSSYRGLVHVGKHATNVKSSVRCDALLLDEKSISDTYPYMDIYNDSVRITHEATVGRIDEEQLFYLMSRGIPEDEASKLIVNGFIEPVAKELPMEYAVELNRLIEISMDGSIG